MAVTSEAGSVFAARIMTSIANMAVRINGDIAVEVVEGPFSTLREGAVIAEARVVAVVDMAIEAGMAVEPGPSPDEDAADKPVRPVITIGRAIIGCVVEVAVRADRGNADADPDLGR